MGLTRGLRGAGPVAQWCEGTRLPAMLVWFKSLEGGYSIYPWVGRCGAAPHTLTLFKTNIADFPTLFKTEFRFLIPCLRHLINIRACKNFAVYLPRKDILFKTKNDKFDTLFKTRIPKNIPWLAARPHYALIREYPPLPRGSNPAASTPYVGWVCCWFSALLQEVSSVSPVLIIQPNPNFVPIRPVLVIGNSVFVTFFAVFYAMQT